MPDILFRILKRLFYSLYETYAAVVLTVIFAVLFWGMIPDPPYWPVPVFALAMIILIGRKPGK